MRQHHRALGVKAATPSWPSPPAPAAPQIAFRVAAEAVRDAGAAVDEDAIVRELPAAVHDIEDADDAWSDALSTT
jgi:hypothetical protein